MRFTQSATVELRPRKCTPSPYAQSRIRPSGLADKRRDDAWNGVPWDERVERTSYVLQDGAWVAKRTTRAASARAQRINGEVIAPAAKPIVPLCERSMLRANVCRCEVCS